jgi:hypothetical protein
VKSVGVLLIRDLPFQRSVVLHGSVQLSKKVSVIGFFNSEDEMIAEFI